MSGADRFRRLDILTLAKTQELTPHIVRNPRPLEDHAKNNQQPNVGLKDRNQSDQNKEGWNALENFDHTHSEQVYFTADITHTSADTAADQVRQKPHAHRISKCITETVEQARKHISAAIICSKNIIF